MAQFFLNTLYIHETTFTLRIPVKKPFLLLAMHIYKGHLFIKDTYASPKASAIIEVPLKFDS